MFRYSFVLFFVLLTLSTYQPIEARAKGGFRGSGGRGGGGHSYPHSSGGLSGGGRPSGGLSGGSHGYPSSGGSHSYPSGGLSGGGHGYPSSGGSYPSSGGSHTYPSSGGSYGKPAGGLSGGGSGSHSYPGGKGVSGNTHSTSSNVHYHYHYSPPQQIRYTPVHGGAPVSYPVYRGTPPTYVYQYRDSGSKYGTLLAGLALFNLGALGGAALASHHSNYKPQPGEVCKFGIKKSNGDYEETKIGCELITSFIFQEQANSQSIPSNTNSNTTIISTSTVTNVTTLNGHPEASLPGAVNITFTMLPNGTLIPHNVTSPNMMNNGSTVNNTSVTTVTTTNTTTTVTNALDVKGKEIEVTPGMQCYVIRNTPTNNMKRSVPCGLLQSYATQSLRRNSATRHAPTLALTAIICAIFVVY